MTEEIKEMEKQIEALGNKAIKDLKLTEDWQIDYLMNFEVQITLLQDVITEQKTRQDIANKILLLFDKLGAMDSIIVMGKDVPLWTPKDVAIHNSTKQAVLEALKPKKETE